jgi:hypothetical protein
MKTLQHYRLATTAVSFGLASTFGALAQAPTINSPPQGTSVLVGSIATLTVSGSGATSYQWLLNSAPIPSATAPTYRTGYAKSTDQGSYQVVLSNGSDSVTSAPAPVQVVLADVTSISTNLVAHYPFEQSLTDVSPEGNSGTWVGSGNWTETGKCGGGGLQVLTKTDGTEFDYVSLGTPTDFEFSTATDFSVSFWVRYTTPLGEFPLIANKDWSAPSNPGWGIAAGADGGLRWNLAGGTGTVKSFIGTAGTLTNGIWHHVAVTFQRNGNATTYLDGAIAAVTPLSTSANDLTTAPGLGVNIGQDGTGTYTGGGAAGISTGLDDLGIWRKALTADEVYWLFAKGERGVNIEQNAFGIVGPGQPTHVTGQWDFDNGDLKATIGQDLDYGDGPGGYMNTQSSFNSTTGFGIPDIGGTPAKLMKYLRSETVPDNYVAGYTMHHGIPPNGGGTLVNQWTLLTDILIPNLHQGDWYSAVIEIQNSTDSDADVSIHEESPGIGGIGISGRYPGHFTAGEWHRVVVAVDMADTTGGIHGVMTKFIDGVKASDQIDADGTGLDGRFSLSDVAHIFSDGGHDNEVNSYYVNSVQVREGKMADSEIVALGGPQASGIPVPHPKLITSVNGNSLTLSWDPAVAGFNPESTPSLANPVWTALAGAVNNSVTVTIGPGNQFFRLKD